MNNMVSAMVTLLLGLVSALSAIPAQQPVTGVCFDGQEMHLIRIAPLALAQSAASGAYEHSIALPYRAGQRVMLAGEPSGTRAALLSSGGSLRFEPAGEALDFAGGELPLQDVSNRLVEGDNQVTLMLSEKQEGDALWLVVFSPCTRYRAEGYPNPRATAVSVALNESVTPAASVTTDAPALDVGIAMVATATPIATATPTRTATPVPTATATATIVTLSPTVVMESAIVTQTVEISHTDAITDVDYADAAVEGDGVTTPDTWIQLLGRAWLALALLTLVLLFAMHDLSHLSGHMQRGWHRLRIEYRMVTARLRHWWKRY
ncbi:MAG: hypothetical protein R3A44_30810 [Caldilineaceae bacterium]